MRTSLNLSLGALAIAGATLACSRPSSAVVCSVLNGRPCVYYPYHQPCSVFRRRGCTPELNYPFGEQLQLTIESRSAGASGLEPEAAPPAASKTTADQNPQRQLRTIRDVFTRLRGCWVPPVKNQAEPGTQLSVRLSFKRDGEIFGEPRVTYVTPGLAQDVRQTYWQAILAALKRCTPLDFSRGLGGALAGRPFAIRFIDHRERS